MAYTLYTDKNENFVAEVAVKNASMRDAFARVIVECDGMSLMFPGIIKEGKCEVPIKRLKGILDENTKGKIHLEVVVEDTYFKPWQDNFIVEQHTAVKVKIQEQKRPSKPMVEVKAVKNQTKLSDAASELVFIFERVGFTKSNIGYKKNDLKQVIKEYFKANPEHQAKSRNVIADAVAALR